MRKCEVCEIGDSIGVCSSGLAAYSVSICSKCLEAGAEQEVIFQFMSFMYGTDIDEMNNAVTFSDGRYMQWQEWVMVRLPRLPTIVIDDDRPLPDEP